MKGHIVKRSEKTYSVVVELSRDPLTGKRKQKWFTVKGNKKEAERFLAKKITDLEENTYVSETNDTFGQYLEQWLDDYVKDNLRPRTAESYEQLARNHIIPILGKIKLQKLLPNHLSKFYTDRLRNGRMDGNGGLSPRTVRYLHSIIREALNHAVKLQIVNRNVAEAVNPPKNKTSQFHAWTHEEARKFLDSVKDERLYALYVLALTTGMRRGELLGLCWKDIAFDKRILQVRRALVRANHELILQEPKTAKGRRSIPISEMACAALKARLKEQELEKKLTDYQEQGFVFTNESGGPLDPHALTKQFKRYSKKAGLPEIRFHDLRHTHASLLLEQGIHPKAVSERLGHSQISITLDTYTHVIPSLQEQATDQFDKLIFGDENGQK